MDCMEIIPILENNLLYFTQDNPRLLRAIFALCKCFANKLEKADVLLRAWVDHIMTLHSIENRSSFVIQAEIISHVRHFFLSRIYRISGSSSQ